MTYYVYENWRAHGHTARVHRSDCGMCKEGRGIHNAAGQENGCWHGPFSSLEDAVHAGRTRGAEVTYCRICTPTAKNFGIGT
jgi:hypothetical protein